MGWWSNGGQRYPRLPKDAVWGAGAGDQLLLVVPSLNLIMVRNGETLTPGPDEPPVRTNDVLTLYHDYRARILFEPLVAAVTDVAVTNAVPRSSLIQEIRWAPTGTISRAARGSDNWPLTWADDDSLYGAYGDGNGFEPFDKEKLSLGLARIEGTPENFRGRNLRALSLRSVGDGARGRKGSGLLCVNGVLHLWMRNTGNSQLAWSADHGTTWSCPTFVNYGRDYKGNRDGFAYILSPDANDAYTVSDRFVLARVRLDRIREHTAYEFLVSFDSRKLPVWTTNLAQRSSMLSRPGACYRPAVTFNAALNRFLLVHTKPNARSRDAAGKIDVRFHGGLSVYEAPHPWGPWSLAFDADEWDVGPGDSASFPSKWISADGTTLHLVFSDDDSFSVRRAALKLAGKKF
jgi:hypothetical protein